MTPFTPAMHDTDTDTDAAQHAATDAAGSIVSFSANRMRHAGFSPTRCWQPEAPTEAAPYVIELRD